MDAPPSAPTPTGPQPAGGPAQATRRRDGRGFCAGSAGEQGRGHPRPVCAQAKDFIPETLSDLLERLHAETAVGKIRRQAEAEEATKATASAVAAVAGAGVPAAPASHATGDPDVEGMKASMNLSQRLRAVDEAGEAPKPAAGYLDKDGPAKPRGPQGCTRTRGARKTSNKKAPR